MGSTKLNVVGARRVVGRFARRIVPPLGPIASFLYVLWTTVGLSNDLIEANGVTPGLTKGFFAWLGVLFVVDFLALCAICVMGVVSYLVLLDLCRRLEGIGTSP